MYDDSSREVVCVRRQQQMSLLLRMKGEMVVH
jgi:hypothetical protein